MDFPLVNFRDQIAGVSDYIRIQRVRGELLLRHTYQILIELLRPPGTSRGRAESDSTERCSRLRDVSVQQRSYTPKDGSPRTVWEVVVDHSHIVAPRLRTTPQEHKVNGTPYAWPV